MTTLRGPRVMTAELALAGVTLTVILGFARLFGDGGWFTPLVLAALLTHGFTAACRRNGIDVLLQIATVGVGMLLLSSWLFAADTLWYGLPTGATFDALGAILSIAAEEYPTARAPVEPLDGFVLASMLGVSLVSLMANIAAFSLRAPLQALVPPFTLFVLGSLLGSGEHRVTSAALFILSAGAFVLGMRGVEAATTTTWLPGDDRRGPDALVRLGGGLLAVSAVVGVVFGPALPGAADEGMWTWRGKGGPGTREVVSPLVDIRGRLVNQSREVAFTVESPEPSYWRLMSLDEFDGRRWTARSQFRDVSGSFADAPPDAGVEQQFEIRRFASEYLPAAYEPVEVRLDRGDVSWDPTSATLLLDERTSEGFEFTVRSVLPDHSPEELRAADGTVPREITERYTGLPEMDPRVHQLAQEVTAEAPTAYDQALALQMFFRDEFDYTLDIPEGADEDAIATFLFDRRSGYCEQFAASFAAMGRSLGLPTRVAVGYTEGDRSRARPEFFTVRGENSHAWPEVYFAGVGWVPFEPTPGRAVPGGEGWTTLQSETSDAPDETTEPTAPGDVPEPTIPPGLEDDLFPDLGEPGGGAMPGAGDEEAVPPAVVWSATVAAAVAAWVALVRGVARWRVERRRAAASGPGSRVLVAWEEAVAALGRRGRHPLAAETYREYAHRLARLSPMTRDDLVALAEVATVARYGVDGVDDDDVAAATERADRIVRSTREALPWWRRVLAWADPRDLVDIRPRPGRRQATVLSPS